MAHKTKALRELIIIALSAAIITVCSWISIPLIVPVTLQSLAIFLIAGLFPIKISLSAVSLYLLLGFLGLPVFAGFNGGFTALLGASGGFLIGFIPAVLIISALKRSYQKSNALYALTMTLGLLICYIFGCCWYMLVFCYGSTPSLFYTVSVCVFPFILFDAIKIFSALLIRKKLVPYIQRLLI